MAKQQTLKQSFLRVVQHVKRLGYEKDPNFNDEIYRLISGQLMALVKVSYDEDEFFVNADALDRQYWHMDDTLSIATDDVDEAIPAISYLTFLVKAGLVEDKNGYAKACQR